MHTINFDPIPQASGFRTWVQDMYVNVCAGSKRNMFNTLRSIKDVENATAHQQLKHPTRKWDDLDTSLAQAVVDEATGPLKRDLLRNREEMTRWERWWIAQQFGLCSRDSSWKGGKPYDSHTTFL